ncbi:MAG: hypothetical protein ACI4U1_00875 [Anaerovoracaceae bacterium]
MDRYPNEQTGIQIDRRTPKQIDEQIKKKAGKFGERRKIPDIGHRDKL